MTDDRMDEIRRRLSFGYAETDDTAYLLTEIDRLNAELADVHNELADVHNELAEKRNRLDAFKGFWIKDDGYGNPTIWRKPRTLLPTPDGYQPRPKAVADRSDLDQSLWHALSAVIPTREADDA